MCLCRITVLIFALSTGLCHGQIAEKIPTKLLNGPDGIAMDANGNLFIANWGKKGDGTTVVKITAKGQESVFLDNLKAPDGVTFDHRGALYISCFGSGEVIRVERNKTPEVIASGLDHPSDLKFSANGDLFVSSFGNFNGTIVYRIKQDKTVETGMCYTCQPSVTTKYLQSIQTERRVPSLNYLHMLQDIFNISHLTSKAICIVRPTVTTRSTGFHQQALSINFS
jgi:sugar lactone lactonase YvrE